MGVYRVLMLFAPLYMAYLLLQNQQLEYEPRGIATIW
jgi:hypothetical protein